jgi:hypothetical protein
VVNCIEKDGDNDDSKSSHDLDARAKNDEGGDLTERHNTWSTNFWHLHSMILEHKPMIIPFLKKNIFLWVDFLRVSTVDHTFNLEQLMQSQRIIFDSFYWDRYKYPKMSPSYFNLLMTYSLEP